MCRIYVVMAYFLFLLSPGNAFAQTGSILYEYWKNISGTSVANLTGNEQYPDNPDSINILTNYLEAPSNWNDSYGCRIRGYIHPPVSGNYIFWIASDDNSELWLSNDDKQSHKALIASVTGYTTSQQWTKYASQQSASISLVAGRRYYIEVLHKDGTQNDNCAVGWQLPGGAYERPIPATRLSPIRDNDDYSQWSDTSKLVLNTTLSGAGITTDVYRFPLLVRLNNGNFNFSEARSSGQDIRFAKADGTHLKYQIEQWDTLAKSALIWVYVDTIHANDSMQYITMLWGKSDAVSRSDSSAVFDTVNGYYGVWHLQQNPGAIAPQMRDASRKQNHATTQGGMVLANSVGAVIGKGISLDGTDDYLYSSSSFTAPQLFTVSLWLNTTTVNGGMYLGFGNSQAGASSSKDRQIWIDTLGRINFGVWYNTTQYFITSSTPVNDGVWHNVTAQLTSSGMRLFVDGMLRGSNATSTAANYSGYWRIGYDNMSGWINLPKKYYAQGTIDEIAISHVARSSDWIKLIYENQKGGSGFPRIGGNGVKPLITINSLIAAVPETLITVVPFSIKAEFSTPSATIRQVTVRLTYSGTATMGTDFYSLPSSVTIAVPADSLSNTVKVSFTAIGDTIAEGNERAVIKVVNDTAYRCSAPDSAVLVLTDNDQCYPPLITLEPADFSLAEGNVGTFVMQVDGSAPFSFKWRKNGIAIPLAPNSGVYTIPPVSYADSGARYSCIVTNGAGSDTSRNALLSVSLMSQPPRILRQPLSSTITVGDTVRLSLKVSGTPPILYQWFCGDSAITGANDSVLSAGPANLDWNGRIYYCRVENGIAGIFSKIAKITVKRPSSATMIITGDIATSGYEKIGGSDGEKLDFTVRLYNSAEGDSLLYTETFLEENNQAVMVRDGKFALHLGSGTTGDDLVETVRTHRDLFAEFMVSQPGMTGEVLDRRVPLTASPYSLSGLPDLLKGNLDPNVGKIDAPIGTHYIHSVTDSTYIKTARGWVTLK